MKVRQLSLVVALLLLSVALLAAPVQAGRTMTPFSFRFQSLPADYFEPHFRGAVEGFDWGVAVPVVGYGPGGESVTGYFTWDVTVVGVIPNPHHGDTGWGRGQGTWRIVGADGSGWEGHCHAFSRGDDQPPTPFTAWGAGFGKYKGMKIEWTNSGGPPAWMDIVFEGEITGNTQ